MHLGSANKLGKTEKRFRGCWIKNSENAPHQFSENKPSGFYFSPN